MASSPFDEQVGGRHYADLPKGYQPFQISHVLKLNPVEHTILKYLIRRKGDQRLEDLNKIKHCVDVLIQLEGIK